MPVFIAFPLFPYALLNLQKSTWQDFTWILVHDFRVVNPGQDLLNLWLASNWLVRLEGQNWHSYFLKTSYTAQDKLKSKVHGAGRGRQSKNQNAEIPNDLKGDHPNSAVSKVGKARRERARESQRSVAVGVTVVENQLNVGQVVATIQPPSFVRVCVYTCVCKRDREWDTGRV